MRLNRFHSCCFAVTIMLAMAGCAKVDKDFDLSKINTDNIIVGDEFVAPVGRIETSPEALVSIVNDIINGGAEPTKASKTLSVPASFGKKYFINASLDDGIVESLSADGELSIRISVVNPTQLSFNGKIVFLDASSNVIADLFGPIEFAAASTNNYSYRITTEQLEQIAQSCYVSVVCTRTCPAEIEVNDGENIEIQFSAVKKGGISLSGF